MYGNHTGISAGGKTIKTKAKEDILEQKSLVKQGLKLVVLFDFERKSGICPLLLGHFANE